MAIQAATCGTGGLGKTSLVKTLLGLPYDAGEITTHGLRITELQVPHPGQQDVLMRLAAWDFGGQEIYHATHQFFLTDQSLFVLVWNARTGYEHGRLRYWLDLITARASQAPILIVATHVPTEHEAGRAPDQPSTQLHRNYPQICASAQVDSATHDGITELSTLIAGHAASLPLMGQLWPQSWQDAPDAI